MTMTSLSMLDQAELLQLALNASAAGDSGSAISYLKEATARPDATAPSHYILGAEYAQIKMYDRAVAEMEAALAIDHGLSIARFQLGLLWLTMGNAERSTNVLTPLNELGDQHPLCLFSRGLIHLMRDEFADVLQCLQKGIAIGLNTDIENQALNRDMQKIIHQVELLSANSGTANMKNEEDNSAAEEGDSQHILLSVYTGNENN